MLKRTLLLTACLCTFALGMTGVGPARSEASDQPAGGKKKATCFHIRIDGVIGKDFTARRMESLLKQATEAKPDVVLLEINTPGGTIGDAEKIVDLIITHKDLRFVAFVRKALSAGAAITLACPEIYVTETATIGGATPYRVTSTGRIVHLPRDINEKMQSIWRAACRKAAQRGGHSSLIAEAMVDRDFALTMRKENGKVVLERDGRGKTLAAKGRLLTLTAKEAVDCRLAKGLVTDLDALGAMLGMEGWHPAAQSIQEQNKAKTFSSIGSIIKDMPRDLKPTAKVSGASKQVSRALFQKWLNDHVVGCRLKLQRAIWKGASTSRARSSSFLMIRLRYREAYPAGPSYYVYIDCRFYDYASDERLAETKRITARRHGDLISIEGTVASIYFRESGAYIRSRRDFGVTSRAGGIQFDGKRDFVDRKGIGVFVELKDWQAPAAPPKRELGKPKNAAPEQKATPEQKAARQLRAAKMYLGIGKKDRAISILKSILADYPDTEAAKVAREELEKLSPKDK